MLNTPLYLLTICAWGDVLAVSYTKTRTNTTPLNRGTAEEEEVNFNHNLHHLTTGNSMNAGSMFVPNITRKGKYSTINNIVFDPTDTKRLCSYITALRRYSATLDR
jgi:hypothetical protein